MANEVARTEPHPLAFALAEEFSINVENITDFIVLCKHNKQDGSGTISTTWSTQPIEQVLGLIDILRIHAERQV